MAQWTFVTNHAVVLTSIALNQSITARELALTAGITERAVRGIIKDLETEGYLNKEKEGRGVRYHIRGDLPMRHRTQQDKMVKDLILLLGNGNAHTTKGPQTSRAVDTPTELSLAMPSI